MNSQQKPQFRVAQKSLLSTTLIHLKSSVTSIRYTWQNIEINYHLCKMGFFKVDGFIFNLRGKTLQSKNYLTIKSLHLFYDVIIEAIVTTCNGFLTTCRPLWFRVDPTKPVNLKNQCQNERMGFFNEGMLVQVKQIYTVPFNQKSWHFFSLNQMSLPTFISSHRQGQQDTVKVIILQQEHFAAVLHVAEACC